MSGAIAAAVPEHVLHATLTPAPTSPRIPSHTKPSGSDAAPKPRASCLSFWNYICNPARPAALDVDERTALLEPLDAPQSSQPVEEEAPSTLKI